MRVMFDARFKTDISIISQGEYHVSNKNEIICTTLGSCVAVCLFDEKNKVGGMNHYLLPEPALEKEEISFGRAKYGINSMEMLINEILSLGAVRANIRAKIFGGANMFATKQGPYSTMTVGVQNIQFARKYLKDEGIPICSEDVAKDHARKVYFDTATGFVKLFRIDSSKNSAIVQSEAKFKEELKKKSNDGKDDQITFF